MTDTGHSVEQRPAGLGGMLWLFGVPLLLWGATMLAMLPRIAWHPAPVELNAERAAAIARGMTSAEFSLGLIEVLPRILVLMSGILVAEAFFRRSPRFRRIATLWLVALCLLAWHGEGNGLPSIGMQNAPASLASAVAILYLWLSRRARNTFSGMALPSRREPWLQRFLDGPRDWGGGVWCVAGMILLLLLTHATLAMAFWPGIFPPQPIPGIAALPSPSSMPEGEGNAASALIATAYLAELSQVPLARGSLAQHVPGLLLALWSALLFARRSPLLKWTLPVSALLHVSAQLTGWWMRGDVSSACFDCSVPGGGLVNATVCAIVVPAILLLPAVRRRFRSPSPL